MKKFSILFAVFVLNFWGCGSSGDLQRSREIITPGLINEYISYLASDQLKGRNTPSPELDTAAAYIARQFESFGLDKVNGSYFQKVSIGKVSLGDDNEFIAGIDGEKVTFIIKDDYVPYEITGNTPAEGELVFCGYGIEATEHNYNDYNGIDVKGKVVLLLRHEPGENDTASVFNGARLSRYSDLTYKVKTAVEKGAVGVILVNDPLNHISLKPIGFPWPSLSKFIPQDALPLMLLKNEYNDIPVIQAGEEFINLVFGSVDELRDLQQKIDTEMKGYSASFSNIKVMLKTSVNITETPANNVVGLLKGSDPLLQNEVLIIGAHYDHSGYKKNVPAGEDSIYNGADDNASGTSGVLAVAKAFSQSENKPERSILFITFAGEEKGLFGSISYVDNPLFPLENTVAMLNMDMIGRNGDDSVHIIGHTKSPDLKQINEEENGEIGLTLLQDPKERSVGGSDHAPFIRKGIPALFYFTGMHEDYHKVTDEPELINFNKTSRIAQLVYRTAFRIANESRRYKIIDSSTSLIY